ncbi:hypothetical protein F4810DRAFT_669134 [Camillea tinctor]|nr:hypothetical protein F4810DRAFT_669134 [Camillea tinctor]
MDSELYPLITAERQATGVSIATWFLATTFLIMYFSGQSVKFVLLRRFRLDDYLMVLATASAFGLSFAYWIAASNGLGNSSISPQELDIVQKACYVADILYIPSISLVKLSLLVFIRQIAVDIKQSRFILYLVIAITINTAAFFFASAFQCQVPHVWEIYTLRCFDQSGFWIAFGVIDILTDLLIIIASIMLVWNVQIPLSRKFVVVGCFAPRTLVIIASVCRLVYLVPISPQDDPSFRIWISVVCTEVQVCMSISSACIPAVKPLFEVIEAGVWQAEHFRRRGLSLDDLHSRGYLKDTTSWLKLAGNATSTEVPTVEMRI